jgi:hypothetical protein
MKGCKSREYSLSVQSLIYKTVRFTWTFFISVLVCNLYGRSTLNSVSCQQIADKSNFTDIYQNTTSFAAEVARVSVQGMSLENRKS